MKPERPSDRFWHLMLLPIVVYIGLFPLLSSDALGAEIMSICSHITCILLAIAMTTMAISEQDDKLFEAEKQKRKDAEYAASEMKSENGRLEREIKARDDQLQRLEQRNASLSDTVQNLRIENSSLRQEKVRLILDSAQRLAEAVSRTTPSRKWKDSIPGEAEETLP